MMKLIEPYILTFIPIFVAVDAIGNIPLFVSMVEGVNRKQRQRIISKSVTTATVLAVIFMFAGKWVLRAIGITIPDFQIAGGILLFVISVRLLLPGSSKYVLAGRHEKDVGVFPLGTPLITGPAVLTTTLMMLDAHGISATFVSLVINMLIVWLTLINANYIMNLMGQAGTRAFSKIMYILLASIGVMMVRRGMLGGFLG
ncbi:MAG: MarC family protein [Candidatus Omnitrophica bacterium]|nr:MarC family protein [Candidatus Omnitrophota bacterium]